MNELIPVHDRDRPLVAELDTEMVDWYVSNMPPNTIRVYKKAVDKIDAWLAGLPSTMPRTLGLSNSRKLSEIIPLNRTRMDYQERFEQIIAEYNEAAIEAAIDVDQWFEQVIALAETLTAEEQRAIAEQLSEEQLAVFDLLTRPALELTEAERDKVKVVSRQLLETLQHAQ